LRDPKYLRQLKVRAEKALNSEPPDGLAGFAASWMLWEAVRRRVLFLVCKREGWTLQQAYEALAQERIDNDRFLRLFEILSPGQRWEESLPLPAARIWPAILAAVDLRKRIIHGTSRVRDLKLQQTAWKVLKFVDLLRDHPLGNPMKELPKRTTKTRPDESLREILEKGEK
jgi:hypothetical protein